MSQKSLLAHTQCAHENITDSSCQSLTESAAPAKENIFSVPITPKSAIQLLSSDTDSSYQDVVLKNRKKRRRASIQVPLYKKKEEGTGTDSSVASVVKKPTKRTKPGMVTKTTKMEVTAEDAALPEIELKALQCKTKRLQKVKDSTNPKFSHPGGGKPQTVETLNKKEAKPIASANIYNTKVPVPKDMLVVPKPQEPQAEKEEEATKSSSRKSRPPPIIIHGAFNDQKKATQLFKNRLRGGFVWKHTANATSLLLENRGDWDLANGFLKQAKCEYHTYTPRDEKTHAFVIRGLYQDIEEENIKEELLVDHKIRVTGMHKMRGTNHPLYMIVTDSGVTLKDLQAKVRHLDCTMVTWERHINSKIIIQCHRCQMWGHATTNCQASPRCLKCADGHYTRDCTKPKTEPAVCCNCGGDHPANHTKCEAYRRRLGNFESQNARVAPAPDKKYVAAPLPRVNAWEEKTHRSSQQFLSQQHQQQQQRQQFDLSQQMRQFPPLPQQQQQQQQQRPALLPTPVPARRGGPSPAPTGPRTESESPQDDYQNLQQEFQRMRGFIDMGRMLAQVRSLNEKLSRCVGTAQKFHTFYTFMSDLAEDAF